MTVKERIDKQAPYKDEVGVLLKAFKHFDENTKKLEGAYKEMQEDFKKVNIELDMKNNLLSQILQSLTNAVVAVDLKGNITSFNHGAERITGFNAKDVIGKNYNDILGKNINSDLTLVYTLKTGKHITVSEKTIFNSKGYPVPVSFTTSILEDGEGRLLGALEVLRDLSEVKRMEEEVQRNKTLAALGEMAAAVAHEIRNPLGAMGGYVTLLERDLEEDPPKLELVKKLINTLSSLNKIVSNLMVYTRPLSVQAREMDFLEHVSQVLDFVSIGIENDNISIKKVFPHEPVKLKIDPEKTEQMIINLVHNAIHAIDGGGEITVKVSTRQARKNEKYFLKGIRVQRVIHLDIIDKGKGIREEDMDKIFNPFFTTREDGNGLGLSIVKKIMDIHNGEISVKSEVGKGTTFTLIFPG